MKVFGNQVFVQGKFVPAMISIDGDRIADVEIFATSDGADLIFESGFVVPGLIDIQINGFQGVDFSDCSELDLERALTGLAKTGTTSICPTVITSEASSMLSQVDMISSQEGPAIGARNLGVHLEGPCISPKRKGAHDPQFILSPEALLKIGIGSKELAIFTVAPELEGSQELIELVAGRGAVVSLGHSDATAEQSKAGFRAGASLVTHLFNGMAPMHHRDPGLAGAALADESVNVSVIVDGEHVSYDVLKLVFAAASNRAIVVSDASAALKARPGSVVSLGGAEVTVDDSGSARRLDGTLASSGMTQLEAIEAAVVNGLARELLIESATRIPADLLGRSDLGRLEKGALADLVHFETEGELAVDLVLKGGHACLNK